MIIYTVDAFTNKPFSGNPAGVCLVESFPAVELMQNIAFELGYANTAFVRKKAEGEFDIKWFSPLTEAPLCGHATIGTLHILRETGHLKNGQKIKFNSISGELFGEFNDGWYTLNFPLYEHEAIQAPKILLEVINAVPLYTSFVNNRYFMEFDSETTLRALEPDLYKLKQISCRALITTAKGDNVDFVSRYFAPIAGIDEDPVCASAHCWLIPYWSKKLGKSEMIAHQASRRGGVLKCKNLGNRVLISGEAVTVMKADIFI